MPAKPLIGQYCLESYKLDPQLKGLALQRAVLARQWAASRGYVPHAAGPGLELTAI